MQKLLSTGNELNIVEGQEINWTGQSYMMIISGRQNLLIDILFPIRVDIVLYLTQYQPEAFRKMINSMGLGDMAKFLKD